MTGRFGMKCLIGILCIAMQGVGIAQADITVWQGNVYEIRITDPVVVGSTGGRDLLAFDLIFENVSGDPDGNPFNCYLFAYGEFHQHSSFGSVFSPTLDGLQSDPLDTHFEVYSGEILSVISPKEDAGVAPSEVPGGIVETYGNFDTYSFGSYLKGLFNASGARPRGPLRTADWTVAHFVVPEGVFYNPAGFNAFGEIGGLTRSETFEMAFLVPEPVSIVLLTFGGVSLLYRNRW